MNSFPRNVQWDGVPVGQGGPAGLRRRIVRGILRLGNLHRRLLAVAFAVMGPRGAYWVSSVLARRLYHLLEPLRVRSEGQCRAALGDRVPVAEVGRIAEQAFVHRIWNLVDLMLAVRYLHPGTFARYCRPIAEDQLRRLIDAQRQGQPIVLLTGYYGPYDLLPVFLGFHGIRAAVVYRPHENPEYDRFRQWVRARGGCELIPVHQAADRLARILQEGGTVALVADHHAERHGLPVTFMGLPTQAMKSVGLLAWRYKAGVIVSGIRRIDGQFQFELVISDIIEPREWSDLVDPIPYITDRYLRGLERIIQGDPSQYLWAHTRWGKNAGKESQPDQGLARTGI